MQWNYKDRTTNKYTNWCRTYFNTTCDPKQLIRNLIPGIFVNPIERKVAKYNYF